MTVLTPPAAMKIRTVTMALVSNTQTFVSPLNRNAQTQELPGAMWRAECEVAPMLRADAAAVLAFFVKLRGQAGRFYLTPPGGGTPLGLAEGTPAVKGAAQTGTVLETDGWDPLTTFLAGSYLSFDTTYGRELKMLVEDASADSTGDMTLTIEPPIRTAPADDALLTIASPTGIFRLADDAAAWSIAEAQIHGLSFTAVESFFGNV